jgi:hypothetical protein
MNDILLMQKKLFFLSDNAFILFFKLYIALEAPDQAIAMYKQADRIDDMMRLMSKFYAGEVTVS